MVRRSSARRSPRNASATAASWVVTRSTTGPRDGRVGRAPSRAPTACTPARNSRRLENGSGCQQPRASDGSTHSLRISCQPSTTRSWWCRASESRVDEASALVRNATSHRWCSSAKSASVRWICRVSPRGPRPCRRHRWTLRPRSPSSSATARRTTWSSSALDEARTPTAISRRRSSGARQASSGIPSVSRRPVTVTTGVGHQVDVDRPAGRVRVQGVAEAAYLLLAERDPLGGRRLRPEAGDVVDRRRQEHRPHEDVARVDEQRDREQRRGGQDQEDRDTERQEPGPLGRAGGPEQAGPRLVQHCCRDVRIQRVVRWLRRHRSIVLCARGPRRRFGRTRSVLHA